LINACKRKQYLYEQVDKNNNHYKSNNAAAVDKEITISREKKKEKRHEYGNDAYYNENDAKR
jgi:hypothetical protein